MSECESTRDANYIYSSFCRVIIIKCKTNKDFKGPIEYIVGKTNTTIGRDFYTEFDELQQGDYYMYVEMDWHPTTKQFDYTVTSYGADYVVFESDESTK